MAEPSPATSIRLVSGHPDDHNADHAAVEALSASAPKYAAEWPRETAYRFLHALSTNSRVGGAPTEKDLASFVRAHAPSRTHEAFKVMAGVLLYEAVHGSDRVATEIVGHLERRADALWSIADREDHVFTLLQGLALVRDRMTHSDRSRLDARIRVLLAFHAKDTPLAKELAAILERPESIAPPPPAAASVTERSEQTEEPQQPKRPSKKRASKKKAK